MLEHVDLGGLANFTAWHFGRSCWGEFEEEHSISDTNLTSIGDGQYLAEPGLTEPHGIVNGGPGGGGKAECLP